MFCRQLLSVASYRGTQRLQPGAPAAPTCFVDDSMTLQEGVPWIADGTSLPRLPFSW